MLSALVRVFFVVLAALAILLGAGIALNFKLVRNLLSFDPMNIWAVESEQPTVLIKGRPTPIARSVTASSDQFANVIKEWRETGGDALIIWRQGEIVLERYSAHGSAEHRSRSLSMHKSIVGLIAAIMHHEGLIDLDAPIGELLAEFKDDARGDLTLRDYLQHRTGLERYPFSPPTLKSLNLALSDKVEKTALSSKIEHDSSVFDYGNVNYQIAGAALRRALKERAKTDYPGYLSEKIWQPIGANDARLWKESKRGAPYFYTGLQASSEDWLRVGILLARGGEINGAQIVPLSVIEEIQKPAKGKPDYGLGLWLGVPDDGPRHYGPSTPLTVENDGPFAYDDVVFLDGLGGQRVMVSPSQETVIVRIGDIRLDWNDTRLFNLAAAALDRVFPFKKAAISQTTQIAARDGRNISVRMLKPPIKCDECAPILFSHGAFSTTDAYDAILRPLADAGHMVFIPQHVDAGDFPNRDAFGPDQWLPLRLEDAASVFQKLIKSPDDDPASLEWIAAGHSFGALIAQILGGADQPASKPSLNSVSTPSRVIALSPPGAVENYIEPTIFESIQSPMLVVTGTKDIVPMFAEEWCDHLIGHQRAPQSTALVFKNADHYFNGLYGRITERDRSTDDKSLIDALGAFSLAGEIKVSAEHQDRAEDCFNE